MGRWCPNRSACHFPHLLGRGVWDHARGARAMSSRESVEDGADRAGGTERPEGGQEILPFDADRMGREQHPHGLGEEGEPVEADVGELDAGDCRELGGERLLEPFEDLEVRHTASAHCPGVEVAVPRTEGSPNHRTPQVDAVEVVAEDILVEAHHEPQDRLQLEGDVVSGGVAGEVAFGAQGQESPDGQGQDGFAHGGTSGR